MYRNLIITILTFSVILYIPSESLAQSDQKSISLSLEDCIIRTLKYNRNVAIEVLNPQLADISVSQAQEQYLPQLTFSINKRNTNSASFSWLDAADQVETQYQFYTAQYYQFLPTGAYFSVSLDNDKNNTNRRFQTINPRFGSTLTFEFTQPLLRNFGFKTSNRAIIIAKNNRDISETRFKTVLLETIYNVEAAYWNLVYSIENLKARKQSLALAQDLLEKNKRSVEIGRMALIDLQSAIAEVATREADILEAEALVKNNEDLLKTIINLQSDISKDETTVTPIDKPEIEEKPLTIEQALKLARRHRPDLQEILIDIESRGIELSYAKNQLLPDLNLQASYWSPGISGTQILYENNDPTTGNVIGTIPGGSSNALKDAFNFKYQNWSVGLSLDIPLNTVLARNQVTMAKINLDQSKLRLKDIEQQILLEIKTAIRAVETNLKRVKAYRIARELTEKKLETEEEKLRLGNSTNYDVFLFQRDLSDALSNELKAIIDYNLSLSYRSMVLGVSLEEKNIKISEMLK
jgi:outer membrane protein TolC